MDAEDKIAMNALSFTTITNPEWDEEMVAELRNEALASIAEDYKIHTIYAKNDHTFMGGIRVEQHGDILWMDFLWVEPSVRRKGIGKALLQKAFLFATQHKIKAIHLHTYFEEAHALYFACGFEDVAVIPHWKWGRDCYLMRKVLPLLDAAKFRESV